MFCKKCGKYVQDTEPACPYCGEPVEGFEPKTEEDVPTGDTVVFDGVDADKTQPVALDTTPIGGMDLEDIIDETEEPKEIEFEEDVVLEDELDEEFHDPEDRFDFDDDEPTAAQNEAMSAKNKKMNVIAICVAVAIVIIIVIAAVILSSAFGNKNAVETTSGLQETEVTTMQDTVEVTAEPIVVTEAPQETKVETEPQTKKEKKTKKPETKKPVTKKPETAAPQTTPEDINVD